MTFLQIKYFLTVAKTLSFTKAAEQLYVSQPSLSRHIKCIENEFSVQLFIRTATGIKLTPAGTVLFAGLSDVYENYVDLLDKANKAQQGLNGYIRIGILDGFNIADFMPLIYQYFKDEHPNVDLKFYSASFSELISNVYNGKYDLIFTVKFEVEKKDGLLYQHVTHSKDHIVMTKYHPLSKKEKVTLDDVKNETFVMISQDDNPESAPLIFDLCKKHGFIPNVHYAKTMTEQMLWVVAGMGITILDTRSFLKLNPDVKFYEIESDWDPSIVIAWNQININPLIPTFIKKLNEVMKTDKEKIYKANSTEE